VIADEAVQAVITKYTRESGVRQLEQRFGAVARKVARASPAASSTRRSRMA